MAEPPTAYLRRFYTDTVSNNPAALALALDFYGTDHILFGTDYPWWPPDRASRRAQCLEGERPSAVLGGNAQRILELGPASSRGKTLVGNFALIPR